MFELRIDKRIQQGIAMNDTRDEINSNIRISEGDGSSIEVAS